MDINMILVIDFGGQYNQLITRRVREAGVYSELISSKTPLSEIKERNPIGIILTGGPNSVYDEGSMSISDEIFNLGIPVLGICYGHQLMTHKLGGKVKTGTIKEYGKADIDFDIKSTIFQNLEAKSTVWMSHQDEVVEVPEGFSVVASTRDCKVAAMENNERKLYGLQFHPEVKHSLL